jgi:hypothetical protein
VRRINSTREVVRRVKQRAAPTTQQADGREMFFRRNVALGVGLMRTTIINEGRIRPKIKAKITASFFPKACRATRSSGIWRRMQKMSIAPAHETRR